MRNLTVAAGVCFAVVLAIAYYLRDPGTPQEPVPSATPSPATIASLVPDPPPAPEVHFESPPVPSTLEFQLIGTLILKEQRFSLAALFDPKSSTLYAVRAGDELKGIANFKLIESGRVVFWRPTNSRYEYLLIQPKYRDLGNKNPVWTQKLKYPGFTQLSENHFEIEQDAVQKTLANLPQVLREARCSPAVENGKNLGFRCTDIVQGSVYTRLDIREGDIVCGLNKAPLDDLAKAVEALHALQGQKSVEVCLIRAGKQVTRQYDIR